MAEICDLLEIRKTRTSPGHPPCNGQVERFNSTLLKMIDILAVWLEHIVQVYMTAQD